MVMEIWEWKTSLVEESDRGKVWLWKGRLLLSSCYWPHGVSLWKSISRGWPSFVLSHPIWGWGWVYCQILAGHLVWGHFSRNKEAYVADLMKFPNSILFWYLNFRRCSEDGKLESFYNLMSRIYGASLRGVRDDKSLHISHPFPSLFWNFLPKARWYLK